MQKYKNGIKDENNGIITITNLSKVIISIMIEEDDNAIMIKYVNNDKK